MAAPDPQVGGRWGERLATAGDLNGDGANDVFVAAPMHDVGGVVDAGRVYAVSGASLSVLYAIDSPEPQQAAKFGFYISVLGDVDDDGASDVAVGTDAQDVYRGSGTACGAPEPNGCNEDQGRAWVFSGASGRLLYVLDNPNPQGAPGNSARFGSRIGRAGDLTGDGRSEVIVGASGNDVPAGCGDLAPLPASCRMNQGQAFIFDGANGALLRTLDLPDPDQPAGVCASSCGTFGLAVQGPGDTDGDGVTDQLVDAGSYSFYTGSGAPCGAPEPNGCNESQGRMYVFSGRTGALLLRIDDPVPQRGAIFGFQDVAPLAPGDVDGDGFADLYGNGFAQNGPTGSPSEGRAWVFSGRTGAVLYGLTDPSPEPGGQFGWSLDKTDYDRDAVPDLYVGSSPHHEPGSVGSGGTYVFNGRDGSLLKALELPPSRVQPSTSTNLGPNLGWGLAVAGDLNGDSEPDFLAGAPFTDVGGTVNQGLVFAFLSNGLPLGFGTAGYRTVAGDGGVFTFGARTFRGSTGDLVLNQPIVGGATNQSSFDGYWLVASDGGVFTFGDAGFYGSLAEERLDSPVVEIEPTPTGRGYWMVTAKGKVYAFGDARHVGDASATNLNQPIIGMSPSSSGLGYWLVGGDGGIFSYGDARFFGSTGNLRLNQPVVDLAPLPENDGYYLVAGDGGVFTFGSAEFKGSTGDLKLNAPVVAMLVAPTGSGYWLAATDGGIFTFGAGVPFLGSTGDIRLNSPVNDIIR